MSVVQLDEFKTRQRATWEAGDYSACSPYIAEVGELVVARAGITPGMRVLDVACGTGNAALPAARAGARVTGLDLTTKLLDVGRAKAKAEGLDIEWQEGDAENLPFEDGSFDRVLSTFGHMFAPRHHGAMKHAIGPRREMGVRTLFNLLGPLTNPAGAPNQVIGVFAREWLQPLARVLGNLGSRHVLVVHSEDGMDEISIGAPTHIAELRHNDVVPYTVTPRRSRA